MGSATFPLTSQALVPVLLVGQVLVDRLPVSISEEDIPVGVSVAHWVLRFEKSGETGVGVLERGRGVSFCCAREYTNPKSQVGRVLGEIPSFCLCPFCRRDTCRRVWGFEQVRDLPLPCEATLDVGARSSSAHFGTVGNQAVVVLFFNPLIDDSTGPIVDHVVAKNGGLVFKSTRWARIASRFTEEDWDWKVNRLRLEI